MTLVNKQRRILDRQQWEMVNPLHLQIFTPQSATSTLFDQYQIFASGTSTNNTFLYSPRYDAWLTLPANGMTTFSGGGSAGGAAAYHTSGPTGTASAGSSTTITTALTLPQSLVGYTIRITGGTGAGQERTISTNTVGTNSVITVSSAWTTNPDATSTFLLLTGRFYLFNGSTTTGMKYYDIATSTWSSSLSVTGVTAATAMWQLVATPSVGNSYVTGTATSGTSTTLTNSAKTWTTNQWTNSQVRITSGTGAGQVRTIASNTGTVLTVSSAFSTTPDATSVYSIESNDDYLYATSQSAVTLFRYSISGNTWSTLSPGVARSAITTGSSFNWFNQVSDTTWLDESSYKNGRYLGGFNGGASPTLSWYDIPANTWINYTNAQYGKSFTGGSNSFPTSGWQFCSDREYLYIMSAITSNTAPVAPMFRYSIVKNEVEPFGQWLSPNAANYGTFSNAAVLNLASYVDGASTVRYLYFLPYNQTTGPSAFFRMQIIE